MLNKKKNFLPMLVLGLVLGVAQPAQAGWFNDLFTFNEDQKRPFNKYPEPVPPPSFFYDVRTGDDWSYFYTGENRKAQPYMNGSASMVMRQATAEPAPSALGYDAFARRHYLNNNAGTGQVKIGEPGMMAEGDTLIAMAPETKPKTFIGNPKEHWRNAPSGPHVTARPGDFDYQGGMVGGQMAAAQPTPIIDGNAPSAVVSPAPSSVGDARYQGDGSTQYQVERGDSLSAISDKPKIYGDWKLWPLIYDANRGTIGRDPDLIRPGQNLGIPRDVTEERAGQARTTANAKKPPHLLNDGQ